MCPVHHKWPFHKAAMGDKGVLQWVVGYWPSREVLEMMEARDPPVLSIAAGRLEPAPPQKLATC